MFIDLRKVKYLYILKKKKLIFGFECEFLKLYVMIIVLNVFIMWIICGVIIVLIFVEEFV